jgi:hypothetical protein
VIKLPRFKKNHIYSVLWEDHYDADVSLRDPEKLGEPVLQITRGMFLRRSKKMLVLTTTSPADEKTSREETANLLLSDILKVQDHGEETLCPE